MLATFPATPASNFRSISHSVVELGNLSVNLALGTPCVSESGSCRATETTPADFESWTSSSFAPEERPDSRIVRERSMSFLLFLRQLVFRTEKGGPWRRTYFSPYWLALKPSFWQASASTSLRYVLGVTLTVARLAFVAITTT